MVRIVHARTCCCDDNVSNNNAFFDSNPLPTQGHSYDGEKIASGKLLPWYRPLSLPSSRPPLGVICGYVYVCVFSRLSSKSTNDSRRSKVVNVQHMYVSVLSPSAPHTNILSPRQQ